MKHNNFDLIVAKAANVDLVVFIKYVDGWAVSGFEELICLDNQFFLCLPQHKEACLHWLNGGDVQIIRQPETDFLDWDRPSREWMPEVSFMFDNRFRIKPKKEKRWVGVTSKGVVDKHFEDEFELTNYTQNQYVESVARTLTCHEIEVEI